MDELAKELWYSSHSTINKIEKGINDISYEKLLLFLKKYNISMNEFLEKDNELTLNCPNEDMFLFKQYLLVGGMSKVASAYLEDNK